MSSTNVFARWQTARSQAVYYHRNQQYSLVALTDASGAIVERYDYKAYGQPTFQAGSGTLLPDTAVANRYTYTRREWGCCGQTCWSFSEAESNPVAV